MEPVNISIILAVLYTSVACAVDLQSPKTTGRNSKTKERQNLFKGTKCGIPAIAPKEGRIVGGVEAKPHSWPWQAYMFCQYNKTSFMTCGGSIISDKWIVTAAHCLNPDKVDIRSSCNIILGNHETRVKPTLKAKTGDYFNIAMYYIHEEFNPQYAVNDIALIKLAKPAIFTDAIQPICLPFGLPLLPINNSCFATGWGYTKFGIGTISEKLMQLPMTVLSVTYCALNGILCATSWDYNKDVCNGDSGGPLACKEADGVWYLRGVASTVSGNCSLMGYFTEVSHLEAWIKNITSRK